MKSLCIGLLVSLLAGGLPAQKDDFTRERGRDEKRNAAKDALEGKAPPALQVSQWMNTPKSGLELSKLKGKVVILDFWGVW